MVSVKLVSQRTIAVVLFDILLSWIAGSGVMGFPSIRNAYRRRYGYTAHARRSPSLTSSIELLDGDQ